MRLACIEGRECNERFLLGLSGVKMLGTDCCRKRLPREEESNTTARLARIPQKLKQAISRKMQRSASPRIPAAVSTPFQSDSVSSDTEGSYTEIWLAWASPPASPLDVAAGLGITRLVDAQISRRRHLVLLIVNEEDRENVESAIALRKGVQVVQPSQQLRKLIYHKAIKKAGPLSQYYAERKRACQK
ncbi:MAG: hypothetical protein KVP17_001610 [Porospora cf. gigantea B]|uniref:uncharacterized protein n=1 Tax=Porospora cf. gigantea B TaxID=2853592 RepID=UPI003571CA92|nr:MAG: hypothetical protein KVP17_001610 [Porospora cf. gigantea B]